MAGALPTHSAASSRVATPAARLTSPNAADLATPSSTHSAMDFQFPADIEAAVHSSLPPSLPTIEHIFPHHRARDGVASNTPSQLSVFPPDVSAQDSISPSKRKFDFANVPLTPSPSAQSHEQPQMFSPTDAHLSSNMATPVSQTIFRSHRSELSWQSKEGRLLCVELILEKVLNNHDELLSKSQRSNNLSPIGRYQDNSRRMSCFFLWSIFFFLTHFCSLSIICTGSYMQVASRCMLLIERFHCHRLLLTRHLIGAPLHSCVLLRSRQTVAHCHRQVHCCVLTRVRDTE
jgi:hypothetical protein